MFGGLGLLLLSTIPGLPFPAVWGLRGLAFVAVGWTFVRVGKTLVVLRRYLRALRAERAKKRN
jgi:hypothetical protein